jgi:hypothetical protein
MNGGADETEGLLDINFQIFATETQKARKWGNKKIPQIALEDYMFWSSTMLRLQFVITF